MEGQRKESIGTHLKDSWYQFWSSVNDVLSSDLRHLKVDIPAHLNENIIMFMNIQVFPPRWQSCMYMYMYQGPGRTCIYVHVCGMALFRHCLC